MTEALSPWATRHQPNNNFTADGSAFLIREANSAFQWRNRLTNGQYTLELDQHGRGSARYGNLPVTQVGQRAGRMVYLRDNDTGEVWNIGWPAAEKPLTFFETEHRVGKTTISTSVDGLDVTMSFQVPLSDNVEIWQVKVANSRKVKRRLSLFFAVDWPEDFSNQDLTVRDNVLHFFERSVRTFDDQPQHLGRFFGLDHKLDSFDAAANTFLGQANNGNLPQAITEGKCNRSTDTSQGAVGVLQKNITLGSQTSATITAFLGASLTPTAAHYWQDQARSLRQAQALIKKYCLQANQEKAWQQLTQQTTQQRQRVTITTPDQDFNWLFNDLARRQLNGASTLPSSFSPTELFQQLHYLVVDDPIGAKTLLEQFLAQQDSDGSVGAEVVDSQWLLASVLDFLKETGELAWLKKEVDFVNGHTGSVQHHLIRAILFGAAVLPTRITSPEQLRQHFQALAGRQHLTQILSLLYQNLRDASPLLTQLGENELLKKIDHWLAVIESTLEHLLWDGQWYRAGLASQKSYIGAKAHQHHRLLLEPQLWVLTSGLAGKRTGKLLETISKKLTSRFGFVSAWPPAPYPDQNNPATLGEPGLGENGGILSSLSALLVKSQAQLGHGDLAYKAWSTMNPMELAKRQNIYRAEPYLYPHSIVGPQRPEFGQGKSLTFDPAISLIWRTCLEQILGIQPVLGGLKIDPCLPRDWRQVEVSRQFRGATYHIRLQNPFRVNKGVERIVVDGIRLTGTVIKPFAGGNHTIEVILG